MKRSFSRDGPVASITRPQRRSSSRNRRIPLMTLSLRELRLLLRRARIDCHLTLRVCLQSSPLVRNLNIRGFLEAGVPGDLTRAALRRAWSLDPAIRDFVGLSENSWDFNAPGTMAGFGPIDGEEVERLLTQLLGEPDTIATVVHPSVTSPLAENSQPADEPDPVNAESMASAKGQKLDFDEIDVASDVTQQGGAAPPQSELASPGCPSPSLPRGHGGASPQLARVGKRTGNTD